MADQLLAKSTRLAEIRIALQSVVPVGVSVLLAGDGGISPELTPFVVLSGAVSALRPVLAGSWSLAEFTLTAYSVHNTQSEAEALGDLVRTWALTQSATALTGVIDVAVRDAALPTDPGNVPQVRESWTLTLVRV